MKSESEFAGRTYLVTGGGSGIGRAVALAPGPAEARVVVAGRTPEKLEETVALSRRGGGRALAVPTDVRDRPPSTHWWQPPWTVSADWTAWSTTRRGTSSRRASTSARTAGARSSTSSSTARTTARAPSPGSCARRARGGFGAFGARNVRLARASGYGPLGRRQSGGAGHDPHARGGARAARYPPELHRPGPTETAGAGAALWATEEARAEVLATVPAGRFADPAEIADASLFLLGERASYLTGECLTLDGGQWLGKQVYGRTAATGAR